ncbi:MAG TPA: cell division protein FtsI [Candidatus Blautia merdavium]|uniref:Cell division protein FtsI n=1 Tax=Candidatus Blautia merdavium TaxID=2838494 RepID=A0A9D2PPV8_9FIRM|nr:cell division protein FtsI [Candidatus Blautia merdavium]
MRIKLAGIFFVVLLALLCLIIGITVINAKEGDRYTKIVLSQSQEQYSNTEVRFQRGSITDRNGNILAYSEKIYTLVMDCNAMNYTDEKNEQPYRDNTIDAVESFFGVSREKMEALLDDPETSSSMYQPLKYEISLEEKRAFEESIEVPETEEEQKELGKDEVARRRSIQGVYFEENYKRIYPLNSLACDVIGFADDDDVASWGLEGYYNSTLSGAKGRKYGYFNEDSSLDQNIIDPVDGKNLTTTLDTTIQEITEKYIEAFNEALKGGPLKYSEVLHEGEKEEKTLVMEEKGAENIGVIVADPNNGEVLAMASSDPYDLNEPRDLTGIFSDKLIKSLNDADMTEAYFNLWGNFCISDNFELGSVFKPVTVASALESGAVTTEDTYLCDGGEQIGTDYVKCAVWPDAHGTETLGEVIQNSCNDGTMAVARAMGAEEFLTYQKKFNFGSQTGIDLPGEAAGLLFGDDMKAIELQTSGFGQGFTATMIQEVAAISAVINGGTYYQPHLVKEITDSDGKVAESITPTVLKEVISPDVSAEVRKYMGMSVESGTSQSSKVQGYSMGGKTGTAEKLKQTADNKEEGNNVKNYLVSYVGFAPLDDPQVVIYVVVDTPNAENQASSQYAQYIAQAILSEVLPYMNIYPDEEGAGETQLWEGFTGVPKFTDIETDGVSNPRGRTLEDEEEQITEEDQLNDQYSDGISNEDAGYGEDSQETSDYGEDLYGEDGSYLGDSGEDSSYDETSEEQDTGGSRNTRDTVGTQDDGSEEDSDTQ